MSEKLVNIMIVLSMYLEERLACALFHIIFESNKQSLEFLNVSLNKLYKNKIALPYEVSKWKITKVYKAVFKWLTVKLDSFSINGVTFEVLEQIYKSTVQNLSSDPQDSKNETIQAASYKFMHALNEKREDFANLDSENDQDEDQDQLYQFNSKKMRSVDIEMDQKALKNNFVSIEENQESEPEDDSPHEAGTTPNFDEQIHDHPLKAKFFESFNEIRKARSKIIVNKELNFLKILLNDSSISDFSLTEDEFRSILECCAAALNITNANSKDNFSMLEILILLKKVPINIEDELYDDIRIKARLMLSVFVSPMQEIIEIGLDDILADFYGLLNSYTLELKKVDVCQILADIDYIDDKDDKYVLYQLLNSIYQVAYSNQEASHNSPLSLGSTVKVLQN